MTALRLRLGTRGSLLALAQARWVRERLEASRPGLSVGLVIIRTRGDRVLDSPLYHVGGKGLFIKEIEEALLRGEIDLAVHSVKDVPAELPAGLHLAAFPEREDPRDVLISRGGLPLDMLPPGALVGTSSLRRQAQILALRPDLEVRPLRGNVDTRLRKLDEAQVDAIVLASAGLCRLGLAESPGSQSGNEPRAKTHDLQTSQVHGGRAAHIGRAMQFLDPEAMIPAVGQGALGLECRQDDAVVNRLLEPLNHGPTSIAVSAERSFLHRLGGGCQVPVAAYACISDDKLLMHAMAARPDGTQMARGRREAPLAQAEAAGASLAEELLEKGAGRILESIYHEGDHVSSGPET